MEESNENAGQKDKMRKKNYRKTERIKWKEIWRRRKGNEGETNEKNEGKLIKTRNEEVKKGKIKLKE